MHLVPQRDPPPTHLKERSGGSPYLWSKIALSGISLVVLSCASGIITTAIVYSHVHLALYRGV
jgi:hypothetical protein